MPEEAEDGTFPRRVPALVTFIEPFRMVTSDRLEPWSCTVEQVNSRDWDYAALHEIAGGIDVGLESPFHLLVGRDGALALPPIPTLRSDTAAVEFFNRCLAALLVGGVYCQSITLDSMQFGSIIDWKYLRTGSQSHSSSGRFHELIRMKMAPPLEAIALRNPPTVSLVELSHSMKTGLDALGLMPTLSPEFLLRGVTSLARRDWSTALANLWIVVEQLTEVLWTKHVTAPEKAQSDRIPGRAQQLSDNRTWTISTRHELLHQKGVLASSLMMLLGVARRSRNELSHSGKHPTEEAARAAFDSIQGLILSVLGSDLPMFSMPLKDLALSDPFAPPTRVMGEPELWMEIPKLPGEVELEKQEAQRNV